MSLYLAGGVYATFYWWLTLFSMYMNVAQNTQLVVFVKNTHLSLLFIAGVLSALIAINEYRCLLRAGIHLIPYLTCLPLLEIYGTGKK